jgi:hypothetical protein
VYYDGPSKSTPGYYCTGTGQLVDGRGTRHLRVGGVAIDAAVTQAFLAPLAPAGALKRSNLLSASSVLSSNAA